MAIFFLSFVLLLVATLKAHVEGADIGSVSLTFPSANAATTVNKLDEGSLFIPEALAQLYPDFGGPHAITETFANVNTCPHGIDRVSLELGATAEGMMDETVVGFSLSVNDIYVAEEVCTITNPSISMQDVIYPPIKDSTLEVALEVVFFDGKINSNMRPKGILPNKPNVPTLVFHCAPPFAIKGLPYKKSYKESLRGNKKANLGKLPKDFKHCECSGNPQRLPRNRRPGPRHPKQKFYETCSENKRHVLLPIPNEPFEDMSDRFKNYFSMDKTKFKVDKIPSGHVEKVIEEVCGGRGLNGTLRMTGCNCDRVPSGYNSNGLAFDFEVFCPPVVPERKKKSSFIEDGDWAQEYGVVSDNLFEDGYELFEGGFNDVKADTDEGYYEELAEDDEDEHDD